VTKTTKRRTRRTIQREAKEAVDFLFGKRPKVDPIFAAIDKHKTACTAYEGPRRASANMVSSDPRYKATERAERKVAARETRALAEFLSCRPTTLRGVLAALEHAGRPEWLIYYDKKGTGKTVLSAPSNYVAEQIKELAKSFPRRLAKTLTEIIGVPATAGIERPAEVSKAPRRA
jgi:hypothetical protein